MGMLTNAREGTGMRPVWKLLLGTMGVAFIAGIIIVAVGGEDVPLPILLAPAIVIATCLVLMLVIPARRKNQ